MVREDSPGSGADAGESGVNPLLLRAPESPLRDCPQLERYLRAVNQGQEAIKKFPWGEAPSASFLFFRCEPPSRFLYPCAEDKLGTRSDHGREFKPGRPYGVLPETLSVTALEHRVPNVFAKFSLSVQRFGFDSPDLLRLMADLAPESVDWPPRSMTDISLGYGFLDNSSHIIPQHYLSLLNVASSTLHLLTRYKSKLSGYIPFGDLNVLCTQLEMAICLIRDSEMNMTQEGTIIIHLPLALRSHCPEGLKCERNVLTLQQAKAELIDKLGMKAFFKVVLAFASWFETICLWHEDDLKFSDAFPHYPLVAPNWAAPTDDEGGFSYHFNDLSHPELARMSPSCKISPTLARRLRSDERWKSILTVGYCPDNFEDGEDLVKVSFVKGISLEDLNSVCKETSFPKSGRATLLEVWQASYFHPYPNVALGEETPRVQILTGANATGKSVFLRAVALSVLAAHMGRHVNAASAQLSLCDAVFNDFGLDHDIAEGVSRFRAQVNSVCKFLENGTPNSLGLFDELYHGTSSMYLLALAWATLEAFQERRLRAIVSTHEHLLTYASELGGLKQLRGRYRLLDREQLPVSSGDVVRPAGSIGNFSMGPHFTFQPGAVTDSDALRIAREEGLPKTILTRAEEIIAVLKDTSHSCP